MAKYINEHLLSNLEETELFQTEKESSIPYIDSGISMKDKLEGAGQAKSTDDKMTYSEDTINLEDLQKTLGKSEEKLIGAKEIFERLNQVLYMQAKQHTIISEMALKISELENKLSIKDVDKSTNRESTNVHISQNVSVADLEIKTPTHIPTIPIQNGVETYEQVEEIFPNADPAFIEASYEADAERSKEQQRLGIFNKNFGKKVL